MRRLLPILVSLAPALLQGAEEISAPDAPAPPSLPALSLLPENSILKEVMLPRYGENRELTGVLRAREMILLSKERISGKIVSMELFNPDRSPRGRVDLATALLDQAKGMLTTDQPVRIVSDRVDAEGTGLVFSLNQNQGFLVGPCITHLTNPTTTAMRSPMPALRATALLGASFLPLIAAPPAKMQVTPEEVAKLDQEAVSRAGDVTSAVKESRSELGAILLASTEANKAAGDFIAKAEIADSGPAAAPAAAPKPLELQPDPQRTTVNSDGGMYFDADNGVFVFLKNVVVRDPRFNLDGANELKILFSKKEAAKAKEATKAAPGPKAGEGPADPAKPKKDTMEFGGGNIGDPEKLIATGAVRILQKAAEGKESIEASGALFSYDLITGDIILRGGYPWVKQGSTIQTALEPQLGIRIKKNMEFVCDPGKWRTDVILNDLQKNDKKDDKKDAPKPSR